MKPQFSKSTIIATIFCFGVFAAMSVYAYTAPTTAAPGDNGEATALDVSATDQVKAGGLGVGTFYAGKMGGGSLFNQDTKYNGTIRGGTASDTTSTVHVANDVHVNGTLKATSYLNAAPLQHSGPDELPLCADPAGVIIFCQ